MVALELLLMVLGVVTRRWRWRIGGETEYDTLVDDEGVEEPWDSDESHYSQEEGVVTASVQHQLYQV